MGFGERTLPRFDAVNLTAAFIVASALTGAALAKAPPPPQYVVPQSMAQVQMTFAPVVKRIAPAVVNVYTRSVVQAPVNPFFSDPFFRQFFGGGGGLSRDRVQQSLGSGVIVRPDGTIMTNNHVIQGGQDIVVAPYDKREFKAKVVSLIRALTSPSSRSTRMARRFRRSPSPTATACRSAILCLPSAIRLAWDRR